MNDWEKEWRKTLESFEWPGLSLKRQGKPKSHLSDLWPRFRFGEDYKI